MKELVNFKKDILFSNNIAEISSISLECTYEGLEEAVKGYFLVEGSYRSHELSLNKENFSYKLPFEYNCDNRIKKETANINIKDFTYQIDADTLSVDIEYEIEADNEEKDFLEQEEFDRFLLEHEVDIVNLKEDNEEIEEVIEKENENILEEPEHKKIPEIEEIINSVEEEDVRNIEETVINTASSKEDNYITYHVYVCEEDDTLDRVASKYNINIDVIKEYNDIDEIKYGMKIIIPFIDE